MTETKRTYATAMYGMNRECLILVTDGYVENGNYNVTYSDDGKQVHLIHGGETISSNLIAEVPPELLNGEYYRVYDVSLPRYQKVFYNFREWYDTLSESEKIELANKPVSQIIPKVSSNLNYDDIPF